MKQLRCMRPGGRKQEKPGVMHFIFYFGKSRFQNRKRCASVMTKSFLGSKKAQGMSLNTVIIAIIVLVVLVVLVMIFTGYFGKIFTPSVKSCSSQGGECAAACNEGSLGTQIYGAECPSNDLKCCARVQTTFERQEGVASCTTQGGRCLSKTVSCAEAPSKGVTPAACCTAPAPETCTSFSVGSCSDYGKSTAPGPCSGADMCCSG